MKRTPLKRRVSIRDSFLRKLKANGTDVRYNFAGKRFRKRPLKKVSRSQRSRLRVYFGLQQEFLDREENKVCRACTVRRESGENILLQPSSEVHHTRGRNGALLNDERYWLPTCHECGRWIHAHPKRARELNLLAPANLWGCPDRQ